MSLRFAHLLRVGCPAAAVAALLVVSSPASAYEKQWHAGASLGYSALIGGGTAHGFGGGFDLGYGVKDWLDLVGAVDVAYYPSPQVLVPRAAGGVRFVFDVLQVVPHVGVLVGFADQVSVGPASGHAPRLDLAVPFGADYQLSRSFTLGLGGRFDLMLASGSPAVNLGAFARVAYAWGY